VVSQDATPPLVSGLLSDSEAGTSLPFDVPSPNNHNKEESPNVTAERVGEESPSLKVAPMFAGVSYWDSPEAAKLFNRLSSEQNTLASVDKQISILASATESFDGYLTIIANLEELNKDDIKYSGSVALSILPN
jgi:hypothetical protein